MAPTNFIFELFEGKLILKLHEKVKVASRFALSRQVGEMLLTCWYQWVSDTISINNTAMLSLCFSDMLLELGNLSDQGQKN